MTGISELEIRSCQVLEEETDARERQSTSEGDQLHKSFYAARLDCLEIARVWAMSTESALNGLHNL